MLEITFTPFPNLITQRLSLRKLELKDDYDILILRSDERVNRFLDRPKTTTIEEARQFILKINEGVENNESIYWTITLKNDDKLIGTICYWNILTEKDEAEIGYELHPDFQGKGIMQEALAKVIDYGFEKMKLKTITALPTINNSKSRQLLERNKFTIDTNAKTIANQDADLSSFALYTLNKLTWQKKSP